MRMSESGLCSAANPAFLSSRSPAVIRFGRSKARSPDRGSARIGQPASPSRYTASRSAGSAGRGPANTAPRSARSMKRRSRSAERASTAGGGVAASGAGPSGGGGRRRGGSNGLAKGMFMWTGPASGGAAARSSRRISSAARRGSHSCATGRQAAARTRRPNRPIWSMVCGASRSRNPGGRSAVITTRGVRARSASATAGR